MWGSAGRTVEVMCDVDIEQTAESLHAHAVPDGIEIRPGDVVRVHGMPADIAFGERVAFRCKATVIRAGAIERIWAEFSSLFELTELYEVGFQPQSEIGLRPREVL